MGARFFQQLCYAVFFQTKIKIEINLCLDFASTKFKDGSKTNASFCVNEKLKLISASECPLSIPYPVKQESDCSE